MYIKVICTLIGITTLLVSSLGCVSDDSITVAQFNPVKAKIDTLVTKEPVWDSYAAKITALEARPASTATTFDPSSLITKDATLQKAIDDMKNKDIDGSLQKQIDALTAKVNSLSSTAYTGSTGTTIGGTTGNITQFTPGTITGTIPTSPNGTVVSQINWVQGTSQTYTSPTGTSQNIWYMQRLINQSTTIQYVRPMITLGVSSQYGGGYGNQTYFAGMNVNISSPQGSVTGIYVPPTGWVSTSEITPIISGINAVSPAQMSL
jgi:outer membrane lipoprotein SlyB